MVIGWMSSSSKHLQHVDKFYNNLEIMYASKKHSPDHICNCDEMGVQVREDGGG